MSSGDSRITGVGSPSLTVALSRPLWENTEYFVNFDGSLVVDSFSNPSGGISNSTSWSFTTAAEDYSTWSDSMDITLNTTPLAADVANDVTDFPVLIRLNPDGTVPPEAGVDGVRTCSWA